MLPRERIPGVPIASQEEALSTVKARGNRGSCRYPKDPQISQSIQEERVFLALPRLSRRGSTHTMVARGTALLDSLVRTPHGKASRERYRSLDPGDGKRDTAGTVLRKALVHAAIRDEDLLPWGDSESTPRSMSVLERNPQVPAPTPHKDLGPGIDGRGIPRGPRTIRMGTGQC